MDSYINKIKADYKAEIAIKEAIKKIEEREQISCTELEEISGNLVEENDYYIKKAAKKENEEGELYILQAKGISGKINTVREIKIKRE